MNKNIIQFLFVSFCFFGCNSSTYKSPNETVEEFLNSIHEGNFSKTKTLVTGSTSNENIEVLEDLWEINKNSFTANPSYTVKLESENDDESFVSVKDNNNDFKFQLYKISGSWKIVMRSCGIIDLVRGNPRSDDKDVNEYTVELGDDELMDNTIRKENGDYPNLEEANSQTDYNDYSTQSSNDNSSSNTYQEPKSQKQMANCYKCHGTGMRDNGDNCTRCGGSGQKPEDIQPGRQWANCYRCHGTGRRDNGDNCSRCGGSGQKLEDIQPGKQFINCYRCHGTGRRDDGDDCSRCGGSGQVQE